MDSISQCLLDVLKYLDENHEVVYGKEGDPIRRQTMILHKQVSDCLEDYNLAAYAEYLNSEVK